MPCRLLIVGWILRGAGRGNRTPKGRSPADFECKRASHTKPCTAMFSGTCQFILREIGAVTIRFILGGNAQFGHTTLQPPQILVCFPQSRSLLSQASPPLV